MADIQGCEEFAVFWPRARRHVGVRPLAPRLDTLTGKRVACLWDYLFKGDRVFDLLEERLGAQFPGVRFVSWREFGNTHGTGERAVLASLPARFRELGVDAAISGMGC
jgi:hypothetical protein